MMKSDARKAIHLTRPRRVGSGFVALALGLSGVVVLLAEAAFGASLLPLAVFCVIVLLCLRGLSDGYPHDVLGACNAVTLFRAGLVAVLTGALMAPFAPWAVFGIATVAFALDGVDGWLARRAGLTSAFGARFDMEIDAALGAVLALILLTSGTVGAAVLVLGFSRYVFVIAGLVWPQLQGDLFDSYRRKVICVVQIGALIVLVFPLTPVAFIFPVAVFGAVALLYSFAVDTVYLMRAAA